MDAIHQLEVQWIAAFQDGGGLKRLMLGLSYLGSEALFCVLPFVYFVLSRRAGFRLFMLFSLAGCVTGLGKMIFHLPRPYWLDARVKELGTFGGFGMPSGHALDATVVWSFTARLIARPWAWATALVVILLVSISRVYLGVHFISDVIAGLAIGTVLYLIFMWLAPRTTGWLGAKSPALQFAIALTATIVLALVAVGIQWATSGAVDPPAWAALGAQARSSGGISRKLGEFLGAAIGIILARNGARFETTWDPGRGGLAWLSALSVTWLLYELTKFIPGPGTGLLRVSGDFLAGAISNAWMLFGVPWILLRYGLLRPLVNQD
jgi:membrane-associated phospholipid phosphatase